MKIRVNRPTDNLALVERTTRTKSGAQPRLPKYSAATEVLKGNRYYASLSIITPQLEAIETHEDIS